MIEDYITLRQAFTKLLAADFKYKGKSIIWRTMRTMIERGVFKTAVKFDNRWHIKKEEVFYISLRPINLKQIYNIVKDPGCCDYPYRFSHEPIELIKQHLIEKIDNKLCHEIYSSFTNVIWYSNKQFCTFSFREIASIISDDILSTGGDYLDWYGESQEGVVSKRIENFLNSYGWKHTTRIKEGAQ
jgi:hypothetical protein